MYVQRSTGSLTSLSFPGREVERMKDSHVELARSLLPSFASFLQVYSFNNSLPPSKCSNLYALSTSLLLRLSDSCCSFTLLQNKEEKETNELTDLPPFTSVSSSFAFSPPSSNSPSHRILKVVEEITITKISVAVKIDCRRLKSARRCGPS